LASGQLGNDATAFFTPVIDFDWDEFDKPDKKDGLSWQDVAPVVSELGDKQRRK
jgi:hypothetical protein